MERSGDPTHTAALMNEGVGVPENAAKNDYRTPGVTITEPFVEEGPSVMCKPDEVATVCNVKLESSPEDIGAPVLIENLPTNFLSANELAKLDDPNNLSDTTEPTSNLEMLPESADTGSDLLLLMPSLTRLLRNLKKALRLRARRNPRHLMRERTPSLDRLLLESVWYGLRVQMNETSEVEGASMRALIGTVVVSSQSGRASLPTGCVELLSRA
ncbi:hypothetical protein PF005_g3490 [Phytophthora fragariae]|uniref:Uncharacterized protein n=1 Tax=Phytophthora fragariae TaxID=53985 RepID=A0A6A3Z4M1_9STRA|nr:hypothetical protein PF005_g3490 [Phytophthora fragariae]KAE9244383.1 hypothetical protein PF004_g5706 [Phytophthora fragariae]